MNSSSLSRTIRMLYIPPYYEKHFQSGLERLISDDRQIEYQVFTIDEKFNTNDLNLLLSMCRTIIGEEQIQMVISDSQIGQLIVGKLAQEYPRIANGGMKFLQTLKCINRFLLTELFSADQCVPTLLMEIGKDWNTNLEKIKSFFKEENLDGYVKALYGFDNQVSAFRFFNWDMYEEKIKSYTELYQQQYMNNLQSLFRVYISKEQYPLIFQPSYLIQPFFDLVTYPHWRLVIANACVYNKEIIMWPLVDGYCGWPLLAEKPLAILPILICPSRQLTSEQQTMIYTRFRQHLIHLINNSHLHYGWIEASYFISCTNEIRLISIKPAYSVYLTEAFKSTSQHGNPIDALVQSANRQRPKTSILNGKTVYIHRLWTKIAEKCSINDLINMKELKRIHRSNICSNRYVRLRFRENEMINDDNKQRFLEIGFIQTDGEYYEIGLTNLIEFRSTLLTKPELFPFIHHALLSNEQSSFDPVTCLPSSELLSRFEELQKQEQKDLI